MIRGFLGHSNERDTCSGRNNCSSYILIFQTACSMAGLIVMKSTPIESSDSDLIDKGSNPHQWLYLPRVIFMSVNEKKQGLCMLFNEIPHHTYHQLSVTIELSTSITFSWSVQKVVRQIVIYKSLLRTNLCISVSLDTTTTISWSS